MIMDNQLIQMPKFEDILKMIDKSIARFDKRVPAIQKAMYRDISDQLRRLDVKNGNIKTTVANLRVINSIKQKLLKLVLTPEYMDEVKKFAKAFNEVTLLQNEYWKSISKDFKPKTFLKEVRTQAIQDTVKALTASGIGSTIQEQVAAILRTNITTGGSYAKLAEQLRESLLTTSTDGLLQKYTKQITTDAINQYSAQYTQAVSSDLGFEWYAYQGTDIKTTRPFCDACTDFRYFHVSRIPSMLKAEGLYYTDKNGDRKKVAIYERTGLPHGMIEGTNPANFQINRGGYNCGHQVRPVPITNVPVAIRDETFASSYYQSWKAAQG